MIKRLRKFKKSKQGAILILVVLILALAMIFIASAMMLTQATRSRLYENTVTSQARLTVTSAAEVFLEALKTQEITDNQMDGVIKESRATTNDDKIQMVLEGVPGMSSDPDNCTYLDLYYAGSDHKMVNADFTTTIGTETENVRVVLKVQPSNPIYGGRFKNQIDIAGSTNSSDLYFTGGLGMSTVGWKSDNTVLVRGDTIRETATGSYFYSSFIFAPGSKTCFGGSSVYNGDIVFLAGAQCYSDASAKIYGDLFFLDESSSNNCFDFSGTINQYDPDKLASSNVVFGANRVVNDSNQKMKTLLTGKTCYFVGAGDTVTLTASDGAHYDITNNTLTGTTINDKYGDYKSIDLSQNVFPTDIERDVFATINFSGLTNPMAAGAKDPNKVNYYMLTDEHGKKTYHVLPKNTEAPADIEVYSDPIQKDAENVNFKWEKSVTEITSSGLDINQDGNYRFTPGTVECKQHTYVVTIDGSKNIRIYFASGTYNLWNVVFVVYNVNQDHPVLIVLEDGAKLPIADETSYSSSGGSYYADVGFISVDRGITSAAGARSLILNNTFTSDYESHDDYEDNHGVSRSWPSCYDGVKKPGLYILGCGNNILGTFQYSKIEAYVGLYNGGIFQLPTTGSGDSCIYGRIEVNDWKRTSGGDNSVGGLMMPYCPGPVGDGTLNDSRRAESKYHPVDLIYYTTLPS